MAHPWPTLAVTTATTGDLQCFNKLYAAADALGPADLAAFAKRSLIDQRRTTVTLSGGGAR